MADTLQLYFTSGEKRFDTLSPKGREFYGLQDPETRDSDMDKRHTSMWMARRALGDENRYREVYDNFDLFAQEGFKTTDPSQVYAGISKDYATAHGKRVKKDVSSLAIAASQPVVFFEGMGKGGTSMIGGVFSQVADYSRKAGVAIETTPEEKAEMQRLQKAWEIISAPEIDQAKKAGVSATLRGGQREVKPFEIASPMGTKKDSTLGKEEIQRLDDRRALQDEIDGIQNQIISRHENTFLGSYSEGASDISNFFLEVRENYGEYEFIPEEAREGLVGEFSNMLGQSLPLMVSLAAGGPTGAFFAQSQMYESLRDSERDFVESQGGTFDPTTNLFSRSGASIAMTLVERAMGTEPLLRAALTSSGKKAAADLTIKEVLLEGGKAGVTAGLGEVPEEWVQGVIEEVRRKSTFDLDYDMSLGDFVKRRGHEALFAVLSGGLMGTTIGTAQGIDQRTAVKKSVLAKDGTPFGFNEMTGGLRRVRTDKELLDMGESINMGDTILKAANGDKSAYDSYADGVMETIPDSEVMAGDMRVSNQVVFSKDGKTYVYDRNYGSFEVDPEKVSASVEGLKQHTAIEIAKLDRDKNIARGVPAGTYAIPYVVDLPASSGGGQVTAPVGVPQQQAEGGRYLVMTPSVDGVAQDEIGTFDTKNEANQAAAEWQAKQLDSMDAVALQMAGQMGRSIPELGFTYTGKAKTFGELVREGQMTKDEAVRRIKGSIGVTSQTDEQIANNLDGYKIAGSSELKLDGTEMIDWIIQPIQGNTYDLSLEDRVARMALLGTDANATFNRIFTAVSSISQGGSVATVIEEGAEGFLKILSARDGVTNGLSPAVRSMVMSWKQTFEDEVKQSSAGVEFEGYNNSDRGLTEWFSSRAIDYAASIYITESAESDRALMPSGIRGFMETVRRMARVLVAKANFMAKLRRDGSLPETQEQAMRKVLGLPNTFSAQDVQSLADAGFEIFDSPIGAPMSGQSFQAVTNAGDQAFYSQLERTLSSKLQGKAASVQQVMGLLSAKQGIKPEEVKWSGIEQWLDDNADAKGKVNTAELMAYVRDAGQVKFEEVTRRGDSPLDPQQQMEMEAAFGGEMEPDEGGAQYSSYVLPNGENYREVVLTMPQEEVDEFKGKGLDYIAGVMFSEPFEGLKAHQKTLVENRRAYATREKNTYTSSHFSDIPNYVAHMRVNEREDSEGNQGLFIEEIQSDRHQAGRDKGYKGDENAVTKNDREDARFHLMSLLHKVDNLGFNSSNGAVGAIRTHADYADRWDLRNEPEIIEVADKYRALDAAYTAERGSVPDAPFRTTWPLQMFKRSLRDAVASGKDWIGWTMGETQAGRYDLSSEVNTIKVDRGPEMLGTRYAYITMVNNSDVMLRVDNAGQIVESSPATYANEALSDVVGKELAMKIMNVEDGKETTLKGNDLKMGGEGMKSFYDKMLPSAVNKYVKKFGAKVEAGSVDVSGGKPTDYPDFAAWVAANDEGAPIHKLQITDAMRESVRQGQPSYQVSEVTVASRGGNQNTEDVARKYMKDAGINKPLRVRYMIPEVAYLQGIADLQEESPDNLDAEGVREAYQSLADETRAQYDAMVADGIKIEPIVGNNEPYANSKEMLKDVADNKHLWFFTTADGFGSGAEADPSHPLLQKTGIVINGHELVLNDLFRAVHDYFGHTKGNFQFGAGGEYNAFLAHSDMFTDGALPALAAETLAQNAWVNFGKHIRRADGTMPQKGESDFTSVQDRPFADQKTFVVPQDRMPDDLPSYQIVQTDSSEFKQWFGDSKVVDADGKPLVVYHGGDMMGFDEFETEGKGKTAGTGAFFTNDFQMAKTYSSYKGTVSPKPSLEQVIKDPAAHDYTVYYDNEYEVWIAQRQDGAEYEGDTEEEALEMAVDNESAEAESGIYDVYLSIKDPMIIDAHGQNWDDIAEGWDVIDEDGDRFDTVYTEEEAEAMVTEGKAESYERGYSRSTDDIVREAHDMGDGIDGVIIRNVSDSGPSGFGGESGDIYVAFKPEQIKSATDNRGTFDPNDPRISYQMVDAVHYSNFPDLKVLDPDFHGTGILGAEGKRKASYPELYVDRVYVGLEGYEKEQGLLDNVYALEIDDDILYNIVEDPDGLRSEAQLEVRQGKTEYAPFDGNASFTLFEQKVKDAGYLGLLSPKQSMAALFYAVPTDQALTEEWWAAEQQEGEIPQENEVGENVSTDILDGEGTEIDWSTNQVVIDPSAYPTLDESIKAEIKAATDTIGPMHIDRMIAGGDFNGVPLQGGMFFSAIDENLENEVVWAFNSLGAANDVIGRAKENGGYLGLTLMEVGNVTGNKTFATIWFSELKKAISDKRTSKTKALKSLNAQRVKSSKLKIKIKFPDNHKRAWKTIEEAERAIVDMGQIARGAFYFSRGKADTAARGQHTTYGLLSSKKLSGELGMPTVESLVEQLEEPAFSGLPADSVVAIIYIDPNQKAMSAEDAGVTPHMSYGYVVKGKPVAKLAKAPVLTEHYPELKNRLMSAARFKMPVDMVANFAVTDEVFERVNGGSDQVVKKEAAERESNEQRDKIDAPYFDAERVAHEKALDQLDFTLEQRSFPSQVFAKYGMSMGTRLRNVNLKLFGRVRENRLGIHQRIARYQEATVQARELFKQLSKADRQVMGMYLANGTDGSAEEAQALYSKVEGLQEAIAEVRAMLDTVRHYALVNGFESNKVKNYWPRWLQDRDAFLMNEFGIEVKGAIDAAIATLNREAMKKGLAVDEEDILKVVSNVIAGTGKAPSKPSNLKERGIKELEQSWFNDYYAKPFEAVDRYINNIVEKVENKKFFGKAAVLDETTGVRKLNLADSIAGLVGELVNKGELNPAEQEEVIAVLQAMHAKQPMHQFMQRVRSLGYISTMMKWEVAMVNFEDITSAVFTGGGVGNLRYLKGLFDTDEMSLIRDFGINTIGQDHEDAKKSLGGFMNWGMEKSGVAFLGRGGANTQVNSGIRAYRESAQRQKFTDTQNRRLMEFFGGDTVRVSQLKKDLAENVKTEDTVLLGWNILLDFQPMDFSEMPEGYAKAGNGRIFYMLKTFMLKRWDIFRREGVREMRVGIAHRDKKLFMGGLSKLAWLYMLYLMGGATVDFFRDTVSGKQPKMDDTLFSNMLKVTGISRYTFYEAKRNGIPSATFRWAMFPVPYIDYPMRDLANALGAPDSPTRNMLFGTGDDEWSIGNADTWRVVPFIGGLYHWYLGGGAKRQEEDRQKEQRKRMRELGVKMP